MLKTIILNTLKLSLAAGLIYWLVQSGKLDFKLLAQLKNYPLAVSVAFFLTIANYVLISFRWERILSARSSVKLPVWGLIQITWIGQFFSSVLPGSVSGDLIKIIYVQKYDKTFSKKFIFASILIDRIMGLCALSLMVGMVTLIFGSQIVKNAPAMQPLINTNYILTGLVLLAFAIFFFFHDYVRGIFVRLEKVALAKVFQQIIGLWDDLVMIKSKMVKAIGISLIVQINGVLIFWALVFPFVGDKMSFIQALAFVPLGFITLALPVAPSGLGVGHAIFQKLFELSGIDNGASLFNLYFVLTLVVNLFGVIPYLVTKVKDEV